MKKKIALITALCVSICAAAGCSGSSNAESTAATAAAAAETTTTAAPAAETTTTAATTKEEAPAAEGTVIYDANDIRITATEFTTSKEYDNEPALALDIVNKTGKELTLYKLPVSVGGWMSDLYCLTINEDGYVNMDGTFTIPAGNDTNKYYMHVGNYLLENYGLTGIPDIELGFEIYAGESETPFVTDLVDIVNPDYTGGTPVYDESGEVMYDKNGVKIIMQGETYDTDYWGPQIKLYASNTSDKTVYIRIAEAALDGNAFDAYGDTIIAPGKHMSEEVAFAFIDNFEKSMTEVEPASEITMKFDIYEYAVGSDNVLLDSPEAVTVTYDASTVEKTSAFSGGYGEEQLSEEELAELKGWWTREGTYTDNDTVTVTVTFVTWDGNVWFVNGNFGGSRYWGGNAELTEEGLSGTMPSVFLESADTYTEGDPIEVKVTEDGENGILLTLGTGEEYHLSPAV